MYTYHGVDSQEQQADFVHQWKTAQRQKQKSKCGQSLVWVDTARGGSATHQKPAVLAETKSRTKHLSNINDSDGANTN